MSEVSPARPIDPQESWARILADIAHDVRGAAGGAELWLELLTRAGDESSRERAVAELERAIGRSVRLAEELGDASALLQGIVGDVALPFDPVAAVSAAVVRASAQAEARRIPLERTVSPGFAHAIVGDESAWGRALDRILAAAIAHVPAGSALAVRVAPGDGGGAEMSVRCDGLALPPDLPLLAAWGRPRAAGASFPLGLWLARAFLERAGGRLAFREEEAGRCLVVLTP